MSLITIGVGAEMTTRNSRLVPEICELPGCALPEYLDREVRKERLMSVVQEYPGATPGWVAYQLRMSRSTYLIKLLKELVAERKLLCRVDKWHNGKPMYRFYDAFDFGV